MSDLRWFFLRTSSIAPTWNILVNIIWGRPRSYGRALLGDRCLPFTFPFPPLRCVRSVLGSTGFTFFVFDPLDIEVIIRDMVFARGLRAYIREDTHEEETRRTGQYVYRSKANIF